MKKLKIHFVGIKGVGMTPLAIIAKEAGFIVSGSDVIDEFITDKPLKDAGIKDIKLFSKENIQNQDLVIITGAHGGYENIEAITAADKKIKVITQGEAVGMFMTGEIFGKMFTGVSVAGTHGKTTTSAILATILKVNKMDPSYLIGTSDIPSLGAPGHLGSGKYFIAEADEYATEPRFNKKAKFLWQFPKILVITNIEFDHPDVYASIEDIRDEFIVFVNRLEKNSILICCGDDPEVKKLLTESKCKFITYGFNKDNNYILENVHFSGDHMFISVSSYGTVIGEFMVKAVGEHNALNAQASIIACIEMGISIEKIKKGLRAFSGSKRRLEFIGHLSTGASVYDDYAHHPTEIKKTLKALRHQYPKKKLIAIFQPHTYSRTKKLFEEFISSFSSVDQIIVCDIYPSLREKPDLSISSVVLTDRLRNVHKDVKYMATLTDVVKYLNEKRFRSDSVIVTMGAGDVYKLHSQLRFE
ncbi:MAG TPA: UDP-N-acetylmuramate--L-alanine ligase [Candidatus Limnocylindrales bacterium]|nr:UDP-N-acetylmuramate--L-alanine ligase [Candidatus Limnocylindrales bacterium]